VEITRISSDISPTGHQEGYQLLLDDKLKKEIALTADIDVMVDKVAFRLTSSEDYLVVSLNRLGDTYQCLNHFRSLVASTGMRRSSLEKKLERLSKTLCIQNRRFGVMGPGANAILKRIFSLAVFK
jgi:hypothetical protein